MTNFVYTVIPASEYKDKYESGNRTIYHFNPIEEDEMITCIECAVNTSDADDEQIKADLDTFIEQKNLREVKRAMIEAVAKINEYDLSSNVNSFTINGMVTWFDKADRVGLMNSTKILKDKNVDATTLWVNNKEITIKCDDLIELLRNLEVYALQCYDTTSAHKQNIYALTTVDEINNYDYTADYPKKLTFTYDTTSENVTLIIN